MHYQMVKLVTRANASVRHFSLCRYDLVALTRSEHFKHVQYCVYFGTCTTLIKVLCAVNRTWKACSKKFL